ncbi:hypothetical protein PENTCL1PPCAC_15591, partial [Pristionchus entomophagus]
PTILLTLVPSASLSLTLIDHNISPQLDKVSKMTRKSNRDCLVCGSVTNSAHLGLDVCRACSVFYGRHSEGKKRLFCRSITNQCPPGKGLSCKKCRMHHLKRFLSESGAKDQSVPTSSVESGDVPGPKQVHQPSTSHANSLASCAMDARVTPFLSVVKTTYEKICFARLLSELFTRKDAPSPTSVDPANYPVYPATYSSMNHANRIIMPCLMDFGNSCFPEFRRFSEEVKLSIACHFFHRFRILDNSYRAVKYFKNDPNRTFVGYTIWISEDVVDQFFDDFDNNQGDVDEAKRVLKQVSGRKPRRSRDKRMPDEHEFLALLTLLFWSTNGLSENDEVIRASQNYRQLISNELHLYYRDILKLDEYAARLGEFYALLPMCESHEVMKETFEVFRLLGILTDDSFLYQLNKT